MHGNKKQIMVNISESESENWYDYKWHLKNTIKDIDTAEELLQIKFDEKYKRSVTDVTDLFPFSVTPYYLSLIDKKNYKDDPVFKQSFPYYKELNISSCEIKDPLSEEADSPVPNITHRYPDRVLFCVSNTCAMYCRHCTRKRKVGDIDSIPTKSELLKGIKYIKKTPEIRDVLLSGGDPFMLSDGMLDWLLGEIKKIKHIEIVRIGTRIPVVLPYRITDSLVEILKKHSPLWINTHFNHSKEITKTSIKYLNKLIDVGFPLGNQTVLLSGINDCPRIIKSLVQKLIKYRIRPYYLYQCDLSQGLSHFRTPIGKGIEILESLIGHTTGFAVPTYVVDAPGGGGKIPLMPNYIVSWSTNKYILRNYEGIITTYKEPEDYINCKTDCETCNLFLNLVGNDEQDTIGIEKLLSNKNRKISLTPKDNVRMTRRKNAR